MKIVNAIAIAACMTVAVSSVDAKGSKSSSTGAKSSTTYVRGHVTKSGTYVAPHRKTASDATQRNNFSASGNYNPYTGKVGSRKPKK